MATPKWPGDHEEKHREAAKLGWRRRRYGGRVEAKPAKPKASPHYREDLDKQASTILDRNNEIRYRELKEARDMVKRAPNAEAKQHHKSTVAALEEELRANNRKLGRLNHERISAPHKPPQRRTIEDESRELEPGQFMRLDGQAS